MFNLLRVFVRSETRSDIYTMLLLYNFSQLIRLCIGSFIEHQPTNLEPYEDATTQLTKQANDIRP